jgi:hypothetical protein
MNDDPAIVGECVRSATAATATSPGASQPVGVGDLVAAPPNAAIER